VPQQAVSYRNQSRNQSRWKRQKAAGSGREGGQPQAMLLSAEIQLDTPRNGAQQQHLQSQGQAEEMGRIASLGTRQAAPRVAAPC